MDSNTAVSFDNLDLYFLVEQLFFLAKCSLIIYLQNVVLAFSSISDYLYVYLCFKPRCILFFKFQGLAFLNNYIELRGECQETYYNIARALHQISKLPSLLSCVCVKIIFKMNGDFAAFLSYLYFVVD